MKCLRSQLFNLFLPLLPLSIISTNGTDGDVKVYAVNAEYSMIPITIEFCEFACLTGILKASGYVVLNISVGAFSHIHLIKWFHLRVT